MKKLALIAILFAIVASFYYIYFKDKKSNILQNNTPDLSTSKDKTLPDPKIGESPDVALKASEGYKLGLFADNLANARDLEFTSNGTLLVSLTASGKIVALADIDNNGVADQNKTVLQGLNRPHGIAFYNGKLYVAEENSVKRYTYDTSTNTAFLDKKLFDLPTGGRHFTRSIIFDNGGNLYVSLGSTCDTCVEKNGLLASVLISDSDGQNLRVFSRGLRNAVFLALNPTSNKVYATEMGRDFLGDNLPPDEIDILEDGANYGWPYCYGDKVWDKTFGQKSQEYCGQTNNPYFKIEAHSAPLGLTFINSSQFPDEWQNSLLVSYHGSWNSSDPVGYKIVLITTTPNPTETDFITGFSKDEARPVDLTFDHEGSLFISDDTAGAVYKVIKAN